MKIDNTAKYEASIIITSPNAGYGEGKRAFDQSGLTGHPSFVLIDTNGEAIWRAFGPQSLDAPVSALSSALAGTNTK
ncbi:MAG: hypothetical protein P1P76_04405 [Anaerolineales bacterium]|nr:hypothetical protein [Anaerolineales bacterium]